jgi:hypothetical protein
MFKKIILSFTSLVIIGLVPFALSNQANDPIINVAGEGPSYNEVNVILNKIDLGSTVTESSKVTLDLYTSSEDAINEFPEDETRWFDFQLTTKLTTARSSWFFIYDNPDTRFSSLISSGSETNKFRLTGISLTYSKYATVLGATKTITLSKTNPDLPTVSNILLASFESSTTSLTSTNLSNNSETVSHSFQFSDNIQQFSLIISDSVVISQIYLTYSIDYSLC